MKTQYINPALMPPESPPTRKELERESMQEHFEQEAIRFVRENKTPDDLFDLHDHDKKITHKFFTWLGTQPLRFSMVDGNIEFEEVWGKFIQTQ